MQEIFKIFIQWFIPFACAGGFALISKQLKENRKCFFTAKTIK